MNKAFLIRASLSVAAAAAVVSCGERALPPGGSGGGGGQGGSSGQGGSGGQGGAGAFGGNGAVGGSGAVGGGGAGAGGDGGSGNVGGSGAFGGAGAGGDGGSGNVGGSGAFGGGNGGAAGAGGAGGIPGPGTAGSCGSAAPADGFAYEIRVLNDSGEVRQLDTLGCGGDPQSLALGAVRCDGRVFSLNPDPCTSACSDHSCPPCPKCPTRPFVLDRGAETIFKWDNRIYDRVAGSPCPCQAQGQPNQGHWTFRVRVTTPRGDRYDVDQDVTLPASSPLIELHITR